MDLIHQFLEFIRYLIDLFLHLDQHLSSIVSSVGIWTYLVLFLVIFAETGLVIIPFLPGDSLLFAVGALAALPASNLNVVYCAVIMLIAAILGDAVNYTIGRFVGPKVFSKADSLLLNRDHLLKAQAFYEKHGGKTIILARFMPFIRTFAPFVAGIGKMSYPQFATYNVVGAVLWVVPFTVAGYFFGNLPFVKSSFHYVILAIIVLSVMPAVYEIAKAKMATKNNKGLSKT